MAMIELTLQLFPELHEHTTEACAYIDPERELGGLGSEVEVPLWAEGKHRFVGVFTVDEALAFEFGYRVGVFAAQDTEWSLVFRHCGTGAELLADGDQLASTKCWLIGTCSTEARADGEDSQPSAIAAGDRRGPATRPALRLIRGEA